MHTFCAHLLLTPCPSLHKVGSDREEREFVCVQRAAAAVELSTGSAAQTLATLKFLAKVGAATMTACVPA